jgi:hypothetical protein
MGHTGGPGWTEFARVAHMSRNHRNEQLPETAAMATVKAPTVMFSVRSSRWSKWWANACTEGYRRTSRGCEPQRHSGPSDPRESVGAIQAAERGLNRAKAARDKAGLGVLAAVLGSLRLSSLDQVDNLKTLQEIVVALEAAINAGVR